MTSIDIKSLGAALGEGAAIRQTQQTGSGETHIYFEACEETKTVALSETATDSAGRVLDVAVTLRGVCPGKRTAVGLSLSEVDALGNEYARGFRAVTVPAHTASSCCDIAMPVMRFVLPEDIRVDGATGLCSGRRHFIVRTSSQYLDTAVTC